MNFNRKIILLQAFFSTFLFSSYAVMSELTCFFSDCNKIMTEYTQNDLFHYSNNYELPVYFSASVDKKLSPVIKKIDLNQFTDPEYSELWKTPKEAYSSKNQNSPKEQLMLKKPFTEIISAPALTASVNKQKPCPSKETPQKAPLRLQSTQPSKSTQLSNELEAITPLEALKKLQSIYNTREPVLLWGCINGDANKAFRSKNSNFDRKNHFFNIKVDNIIFICSPCTFKLRAYRDQRKDRTSPPKIILPDDFGCLDDCTFFNKKPLPIAMMDYEDISSEEDVPASKFYTKKEIESMVD